MSTESKKERGVWVTQAQVKLTGSPDTARFLAQCVYWSELEMVQQRSGWFYKTRDEWKSETWLSRFKQEKARKKLKAMGILQERHERRNTGIRLWYRINTGLLNRLLNTADKQPVIENPSICLDGQSRKTGVKEVNSGINENGSELTEPCSTDDSVKDNELVLLSAEISTNVPEYTTTETSETQSYSLNPQDYVFCHVFIYQFIKTRSHLFTVTERMVFQAYGLTHPLIADKLCQFIDDYGEMMVDWYHQAMPTLTIPDFNQDAIVFSQMAGRRLYESA